MSQKPVRAVIPLTGTPLEIGGAAFSRFMAPAINSALKQLEPTDLLPFYAGIFCEFYGQMAAELGESLTLATLEIFIKRLQAAGPLDPLQ